MSGPATPTGESQDSIDAHKGVPLSHRLDAHELESKGLRDLYKIELRDVNNTILRLTPHNPVNYNDQDWEFLPCRLSENSQNSTGEVSRPRFTGANPEGMFSSWIQSGILDGAVFTRYRMLLPDLEQNRLAYIRSMWIVSKTLSLNKNLFTLELRSTMDGVNFMIPARSFYPPDFSHVTLR